MKSRKIAKSVSVFLLLGVFFYATSVKDLHYVFFSKYHSTAHSDDCYQHIHSTNKEADCLICKMDFLGLFHFAESHYSFTLVYLPKTTSTKPDQLYLTAEFHAHYLRGPPHIG